MQFQQAAKSVDAGAIAENVTENLKQALTESGDQTSHTGEKIQSEIRAARLEKIKDIQRTLKESA